MDPGTRLLDYKAEQLLLSSARIKNQWSQNSTPPDLLRKENFTVVYFKNKISIQSFNKEN